MKKYRFPKKWILLVNYLLFCTLLLCGCGAKSEKILSTAKSIMQGEPSEVRILREQELVQSEEGHFEYYFQQLSDEEKRIYREMLNGIRRREEEFYLSSESGRIDKIYHAVLKDHAELYWVHNRKQVYTTTFSKGNYCAFAPGYTYTEAEIEEIDQCLEERFQEIYSLLSENMSAYEKLKIVYAYLIDHIVYEENEHDQNIAGAMWKGQAVCAGYARALQYFLERLGIDCIYVEGDSFENAEGHAWNIVRIGEQYYYVDVTNGDQPDFFSGNASKLEEHKTILYDYLCPFPAEYEKLYLPSQEFSLPECTQTDLNFYVLNQGCFDSYDWNHIYDYCVMRLNNGAAVIRFKFSNEEAFRQAYEEWIEGDSVQEVAQYYMQLYHLQEVQYYYGIMDSMNTIYFMF